MSNVYILTDGCYSDYTILGVFSTREAAEASLAELVKTRNPWAPAVEEFPLDDMPWRAFKQHCFYMERSGDTDRHHTKDICARAPQTDISIVSHWDQGPRLFCRISGRTMEQALKIANEHRVQLIASGKWPEET